MRKRNQNRSKGSQFSPRSNELPGMSPTEVVLKHAAASAPTEKRSKGSQFSPRSNELPGMSPTEVVLKHAAASAPTGKALQDFAVNMQAAARVSNGLALQSALIDGFVPPDKVISELLRFGSMTPKEVMYLDVAGLKNQTEQLKGKSAKLKETGETKSFEDKLAQMNEIRTSKLSKETIRNLPEFVKYQNDLQNVTQKKVDLLFLEDFTTATDELLRELSKVTKMKSDSDNSKIDYDTAALISIKQKLIAVETGAKDFQTNVNNVKNLGNLGKGGTALAPLINEREIRDKLKHDPLPSIGNPDIKNNIETFKDIIDLFNVGFPVEKIVEFAANRLSKQLPKAQHTDGFPHGLADMKKMSDDLPRVVPKSASEVAKGLLPLNRFEEKVEKVEDELQKIGDVHLKAAETVATSKNGTTEQAAKESIRNAKLTDFETCHKHLESASFNSSKTDFNDIFSKINSLDDIVNKLGSFGSVDGVKDLSILKAAVTFKGTDDASKAAETPGMVTNLKITPQLNSTISTLDGLQKQLEPLSKLVPFANNITAGLQDIQTYQTELANSGYAAFYDCLHEIGEDGELVKSMVDVIKQFRNDPNAPIFAELQNLLDIVQNAQGVLEPARQAGTGIKGNTDADATALKTALPDAQQVAHNITRASQGIDQMVLAGGKKSELEALKKMVGGISKQVSAVLSSDTTSAAHLVVLDALQTSLNGIWHGIGKVETALRRANLTDGLSTYSSALRAASKIPSIDFNARKIRETLESLVQRNAYLKTSLDPILRSLGKLEPLDLNFANYKFSEAIASCKALDNFHVKHAKAVSNSSRDAQYIQNHLNLINRTQLPLTITVMASTSSLMQYIIGGLSLLVAILFGSALLFLSKWKKWCCFAPTIYNYINGTFKYVMERNVELTEIEKAQVKKLTSLVHDALNAVHKKIEERGLSPVGHGIEILRALNEGQTTQTAVGNANEIRYSTIPCRADTMVNIAGCGLDNVFIHANEMFIDKRMHIMAMAPTKNSVHKFLLMIKKHQVKLVVQLCSFWEDKKEKCLEYFDVKLEETKSWPSKKPRVEVKAVSLNEKVSGFSVDKEKYGLYSIEVMDKLANTKFTFKVLKYTGWTDMGVPNSEVPALEICDFMDSPDYRNSPVLVHCAAGVGRTGTLLSIKNGLYQLQQNNSLKFTSIAEATRNARMKTLQTESQYFYMMKAICKRRMDQLHIAYFDGYEQICYFLNKKYIREVKSGSKDKKKKKKPKNKEKCDISEYGHYMNKKIKANDKRDLALYVKQQENLFTKVFKPKADEWLYTGSQDMKNVVESDLNTPNTASKSGLNTPNTASKSAN
ncbi:unnamed protein product [Caenorhabditis sp. 36 PRJEB53466]|nr:unnamed protein product [Caenorhabditis sp. 36 PRJEB53466]